MGNAAYQEDGERALAREPNEVRQLERLSYTVRLIPASFQFDSMMRNERKNFILGNHQHDMKIALSMAPSLQ